MGALLEQTEVQTGMDDAAVKVKLRVEAGPPWARASYCLFVVEPSGSVTPLVTSNVATKLEVVSSEPILARVNATVTVSFVSIWALTGPLSRTKTAPAGMILGVGWMTVAT